MATSESVRAKLLALTNDPVLADTLVNLFKDCWRSGVKTGVQSSREVMDFVQKNKMMMMTQKQLVIVNLLFDSIEQMADTIDLP